MHLGQLAILERGVNIAKAFLNPVRAAAVLNRAFFLRGDLEDFRALRFTLERVGVTLERFKLSPEECAASIGECGIATFPSMGGRAIVVVCPSGVVSTHPITQSILAKMESAASFAK